MRTFDTGWSSTAAPCLVNTSSSMFFGERKNMELEVFTRQGAAVEDHPVSKVRIPNIEHLLRPRGAPAKISREAVAYHEAGHVLVCYHYSRDVLQATVA